MRAPGLGGKCRALALPNREQDRVAGSIAAGIPTSGSVNIGGNANTTQTFSGNSATRVSPAAVSFRMPSCKVPPWGSGLGNVLAFTTRLNGFHGSRRVYRSRTFAVCDIWHFLRPTFSRLQTTKARKTRSITNSLDTRLQAQAM